MRQQTKYVSCLLNCVRLVAIPVALVGWLATLTDAATPVTGNQTGLWALAGSPYRVSGDVVVPAGQVLNVDPGVVVEFASAADGLYVDGTLLARGTAAAPITFTSDKTTKAPGQWKALYFRVGGTNSVLEQCVVEYGAAAGWVNELISVDRVAPLLTNCVVRGSRANGVGLFGADARIWNCQFTSNGLVAGGYPVLMRGDSLATLRGNTASGNANNAIGVLGNFTRTGVWTKDGMPYTLTEDVAVVANQTLTIEPGTTVQFQGAEDGLLVDGTLVARGTLAAPITFTSDESAKAPGQWKAIYFRVGGTNSVLEQCVVEYGAAAGWVNELISVDRVAPLLTNCVVRGSRANGISLFEADARIWNCQFTSNGLVAGGYPVLMRGDSLATLRGNTASGNTNNAIGVLGNFTRTGVWTKDGMPYTLTADVAVVANQTLTIEPGTTIQFQGVEDGLLVDGTLVARGTLAAPITFTSDKTAKAPGQWKALYFRVGGTNSVLEQCVVEYGAAAGWVNELISVDRVAPLLTNCVVRGSRANGISLFGADARIWNCQFTSNGLVAGGYPVLMRADSLATLRGNTASGNTNNAIGVLGNFTRTGVWTKDGMPYTLTADVAVVANQTLTIEPGTTVQFQGAEDGLLVDGTLVARGTLAAPITFTSDKTAKAPGQWKALYFRVGGTNSVLEQCVVECGAAAGWVNESVSIDRTTLLIANVTIQLSGGDGLFVNNASLQIRDSRLVRNVRDGLRTVGAALPAIHQSVISGNGGKGVENLTPTAILDARNNYWGDPSGPLDILNTDGRSQTNPNGKGDKVSEYVDWSGFLSSDPRASVLGVPEIEVLGEGLDFGTVNLGSSVERGITIRNVGSASLTIHSATSDSTHFVLISPAPPFNVLTNGQQTLVVRFTPDVTNRVTATLTIASDDADEATLRVALAGSGLVAATNNPAPVAGALFSDSFNRPDADRCALGASDNALGGSGTHHYLPLFPTGGNNPLNPIGASLLGGTLSNHSLDYGGVQFVATANPCTRSSAGENLGQDLNIRVELRVPTDTTRRVTQAGPFFRARPAVAGDGIIGGANTGYWVQLHSTGEVKVKDLATASVLASSGTPATFDPTMMHSMEIAARGEILEVALDGRLLVFEQSGVRAVSVRIAASAIGAAGLAFGAEPNRGQIGGQTADNIVVRSPASLSALPRQDNFALVTELRLEVTRESQGITLRWTAQEHIFLESTSDLTPPATWTAVAGVPTTAAGVNSVILPFNSGRQFFRLRSFSAGLGGFAAAPRMLSLNGPIPE